MGQAKLKQRAAFAPLLIEDWESEDCVNFAAALARVSGWLLHVDWWVPSTDPDNNIGLEHCKPLRVYVADNGDRVFDARGVRSVFDFNYRTIRPMAVKHGTGGVRTRFYSEVELASLPLRVALNTSKVESAIKAIEANTAYLATIPIRAAPFIPAADAAAYTFGLCAAFAEAMRELKGLEPVALLALRFKPGSEGTQRGRDGFVHSLSLHKDGTGEDSWGRANIRDIADRFGIQDFRLSQDAHERVVETLRRTSADRFESARLRATDLIQRHVP